MRYLAAICMTLLLIGCADPKATQSVGQSTLITAGSKTISIPDPSGFCLDDIKSFDKSAHSTAIYKSCGQAEGFEGIMMVSAIESDQDSKDIVEDTFATESTSHKMISKTPVDNAVLLHTKRTGPMPNPTLSDETLHSVFNLPSTVIHMSLVGLEGSRISSQKGLEFLLSVSSQMIAANSPSK